MALLLLWLKTLVRSKSSPGPPASTHSHVKDFGAQFCITYLYSSAIAFSYAHNKKANRSVYGTARGLAPSVSVNFVNYDFPWILNSNQ